MLHIDRLGSHLVRHICKRRTSVQTSKYYLSPELKFTRHALLNYNQSIGLVLKYLLQDNQSTSKSRKTRLTIYSSTNTAGNGLGGNNFGLPLKTLSETRMSLI